MYGYQEMYSPGGTEKCMGIKRCALLVGVRTALVSRDVLSWRFAVIGRENTSSVFKALWSLANPFWGLITDRTRQHNVSWNRFHWKSSTSRRVRDYGPVGVVVVTCLALVSPAINDTAENQPVRGKVDEGRVDEGRVDEGKVDEGRVDEGKVDEGRVDEGKVDEEKVDEGKVDEGKVDEGKVDKGRVDEGRVDDGRVDEGRVDEGKVDEGRVDEGRVDDGRVDEGKVDEGRVDEGKVDEGKVDEGKVDEGRVDEGRVDEGKVDEGRVDDGRVDKGRVDDGRVDDGRVDDGRVDEGKVDDGRVDEGRVDDGRVDEGKVDDGRVDEGRVDDGRVDEGRVDEGKGLSNSVCYVTCLFWDGNGATRGHIRRCWPDWSVQPLTSGTAGLSIPCWGGQAVACKSALRGWETGKQGGQVGRSEVWVERRPDLELTMFIDLHTAGRATCLQPGINPGAPKLLSQVGSGRCLAGGFLLVLA
ncbi:hypothetical protein RRG08_020012 [Elysia crispata]|uniref:Uncharacterized protein n=1 Tax=Elysia crispata TaxID=231223 RepID=A0AAE1BCQ4_9GAST|nr:hypothetical protein RRG08_020012 [Elysia crispata]